MMMLYDVNTGKAIRADKCNRPSFNDRNGRTWDTTPVEFNGQVGKIHLDVSRGSWGYFQLLPDTQWYKARLDDVPYGLNHRNGLADSDSGDLTHNQYATKKQEQG